jgi:sugar diacid utilization regulator
MDSYRICVRFLWDELQAEASRVSAAADVVLVRASSAMWTVLDEFTTAMVSGYQEEMTHQLVNRQQERSAMVQALIDGRLTDTVDLWNTADTLRISLQGPYVVVCAELAPGRPFSISERRRPAISARSFLCVAVATRYRDRSSASRPVHGGRTRADCVGRLPASSDRDQPAIRRSRTTAAALRYARIAMTASRPDREPITVFDRDVLAVAAVGAPEVMSRIAANVLGPLDDLPDHEREALLDTLEARFDNGGSAERAAQELYVHPNTVRQRLRKLEQRTGRSVTDPRAAAELCIALETARRNRSGQD